MTHWKKNFSAAKNIWHKITPNGFNGTLSAQSSIKSTGRSVTQLVLQLVLFSSHHSAWLFICEIKTDTHKWQHCGWWDFRGSVHCRWAERCRCTEFLESDHLHKHVRRKRFLLWETRLPRWAAQTAGEIKQTWEKLENTLKRKKIRNN